MSQGCIAERLSIVTSLYCCSGEIYAVTGSYVCSEDSFPIFSFDHPKVITNNVKCCSVYASSMQLYKDVIATGTMHLNGIIRSIPSKDNFVTRNLTDPNV